MEISSKASENVKALKRGLRKAARVESGTVVRWVAVGRDGARYTYVAVYVIYSETRAGRWYISGGARFYGATEFDYDGFMGLLNREDVETVEVAVGFETLRAAAEETDLDWSPR